MAMPIIRKLASARPPEPPQFCRPRWFSSYPLSDLDPDTYSPGKPRDKTKTPKDRLSSVIDAVNDRKLPPELRGQRGTVKTETDIANVVEQRIWHSMLDGQFENLPGKGKPLNLDAANPHADPAEDTLYRILSRNKCAPEWVELNKEIRDGIAEWRKALRRARGGSEEEWREAWEGLKARMRAINDKVFRYNLIVPFGRQMFGIKWEKELDRLKEEEEEKE